MPQSWYNKFGQWFKWFYCSIMTPERSGELWQTMNYLANISEFGKDRGQGRSTTNKSRRTTGNSILFALLCLFNLTGLSAFASLDAYAKSASKVFDIALSTGKGYSISIVCFPARQVEWP